jgi:hypothetical protein
MTKKNSNNKYLPAGHGIADGLACIADVSDISNVGIVVGVVDIGGVTISRSAGAEKKSMNSST